jgi:glycosyltransferase involved in cell wall biosynthesis
MAVGFYSLGGFSTVIENLADQLGKMGIEATIGALAFKRIPPKASYNISTLPVHNASKLKRFLSSFDIVHNHHPITNYLALLSQCPFVYHYHGAPDLGRGNLFRFSMLSSIKITNHRFDAVITVSEYGAAELKRYFNINKVYVVYNGVDTKRFKPGLAERFRKGSPQFLFVGNLHEHKKVEELIIAFRELVKEYPKAHLQIVGSGHMHERVKHLVLEFGLGDNVELVGYVSDSELPSYYASCDVYATASRWELFGLPLQEAMACGKPVVASSIPSHVELLAKSKAGTTYAKGDINDLCEKMAKTSEETDKYKINAIRFSKEHDWTVVAERILKIYDQMLD